jgi:hypothetical protein
VVVSFKAPENLVVTIENDLEVSKKVNIKATADYALFYDVYFGEAGKPNAVLLIMESHFRTHIKMRVYIPLE